MRFKKLKKLPLTLACLSTMLMLGCSTLYKNQGRYDQTDWYEVGRQDGISGEPISKFKSYILLTKHTKSLPPNQELYTAGRERGLSEYCTPKTAQQLGKMGATYNDVCPGFLKEDFAYHYALGQRIYELSNRKVVLDEQILQTTLALKNSKQPSQQKKIKSQLDVLQRQMSSLDSELATIELRSQTL